MKKEVNALNGLISFLHNKFRKKTVYLILCQCPERAYFISTDADLERVLEAGVSVSMP